MTHDIAAVEARVGRRLTAAEQHIDVLAIDALLNRAKDDLERAIKAEQRSLGRQLAQQTGGALNVTGAMLAVLRRLQTAGRSHGARELASMGYTVRRFAAGDEHPGPPTIDDFATILAARLRRLTIKIHQEALGGDVSLIAATAIERAVGRVLGARAIASDLVSPVFVSGLSQTFEQHADLVEAWQYTAVNDGGLCEQCAPHDGETYDTLAALFDVLPGFGPNPDCLGGDRCRCRAVPMPPT